MLMTHYLLAEIILCNIYGYALVKVWLVCFQAFLAVIHQFRINIHCCLTTPTQVLASKLQLRKLTSRQHLRAKANKIVQWERSLSIFPLNRNETDMNSFVNVCLSFMGIVPLKLLSSVPTERFRLRLWKRRRFCGFLVFLLYYAHWAIASAFAFASTQLNGFWIHFSVSVKWVVMGFLSISSALYTCFSIYWPIKSSANS